MTAKVRTYVRNHTTRNQQTVPVHVVECNGINATALDPEYAAYLALRFEQADRIAEAVFNGYQENGGATIHSEDINCPDSGYVVARMGNERTVKSNDFTFHDVFSYVVDKLDIGLYDGYVGIWEHNGYVFLDVCDVLNDHDAAAARAAANNQISFYDIVNQVDIDVRYA